MAQGRAFVTLENRGLFFALKQSVTFDLPYISVQCILELFAIKTLLHDIFLYRDCLKGYSSFIPLNILKNIVRSTFVRPKEFIQSERRALYVLPSCLLSSYLR